MGCRRIGAVLLEVKVGGRGCLMIMIVIGCFFYMWCFLRLLWIRFAFVRVCFTCLACFFCAACLGGICTFFLFTFLFE